ncbi:Stp1/IreP family PP2C-type Ser/Thr phosphatase [Lusitaniella coriacea LEGE 07157]|uniref:Stp1/IreP family PP2C-type Ser/Thr phosphatase n=1 Tax=Lusitaniella coriacea LEGE 07157 TaxID=945747 RepID=A0A8J7DSL1_9CYAN|nr:Stp1/IreP family PP2C-type Ser/Thr phosphatase [Lusitaniella coriacea]MBE9114292.1 Stp1/IreP family PP2C-type Ser/Thr phosphatase [Lusitaniella coriacea LEGE 07157]
MKPGFTGLTDTGVVRSVNQDDYYIDPEGRFFIVADGMGGHAGGQEASQIATKTVRHYLEQHWDERIASEVLLEKSIFEANQGILDDQHEHPERADMGTTVVVVIFRKGQPWYSHVGDSRFYRLRDRVLEQITEDQTWVARALKMGDLTPEEARIHPWRHVLSQCLGRRDLQRVEVHSLEVAAGDCLLLCSDGLTEEVSDEALSALLQSNKTCEEAAEALVEEAKQNGGSDNITVVLLAR